MDFVTAIAVKAYAVGLVSFVAGFIASFFNENMGYSLMSCGMVFGLFAASWSIGMCLE